MPRWRPTPLLFLDAVNRDPQLIANMIEVLDRARSPYDVVPNARMLGWAARALLRGRLDVVRAFPSSFRNAAEMQRALRPRLRLQARARQRLASAPAAQAMQQRSAQIRNETPATSDG